MLKAERNQLEFIIEEDNPDVGVYLYVYEDGKCARDLLQNDIPTCIAVAFEEYGVPRDLWREVENTETATEAGTN